MVTKRTKVICPICDEVKTTRYSKFRHCGIQHETSKNLFYSKHNQSQPDTKGIKDTKDTTEIKPTKIVKDTKGMDETKEVKGMDETKVTKDTTIPEGTKDTKGIKVTLIDEDTKEVLLSTDAAIVMSPNETLFSGEVEATCKRHNNSGKTEATANNPQTVEVPKPQIGLLDKVMQTLKNPLVAMVGTVVGGYAIKRFVETKEANAAKDDTNW